MTGVQQVGTRVEELLAALRTSGGVKVAAAAEELVGLLVGLYGDGLAQIVTVLREQGEAGAVTLARLAEDPLVESLLLLHGLHPLDVDARVPRALDPGRPYHGCPSSTVTVQLAIQGAVEAAAPEVTQVVVEGMTEPPGPKLLQIGRPSADGIGPGSDPAPTEASGGAAASSDVSWGTLPSIGPPSSRPVTASADGTSVLVCAVRGTLYAYRDACAACGSSLGDGTLDRERLTWPGCGARYDVRLAGKCLDDPAMHLDPLPLLTDSAGVRVALPQAVRT